MYLVDTPGMCEIVYTQNSNNYVPSLLSLATTGVMIPNITNPELVLKLAVAGVL